MKITIDLNVNVSVPQLKSIGVGIMAGLKSVTDALTNLEQTLDQELTEIADALQNTPTQEEVDALAARVLSLRDRIANIIP